MIYNTRNRSNDTTESQKKKKKKKKKTCFNVASQFLVQSVKNDGTKITYRSQYCV